MQHLGCSTWALDAAPIKQILSFYIFPKSEAEAVSGRARHAEVSVNFFLQFAKGPEQKIIAFMCFLLGNFDASH